MKYLISVFKYFAQGKREKEKYYSSFSLLLCAKSISFIKRVSIVVLFMMPCYSWCQQVVTVTDSLPVTINGLKMGYNIISEQEKEVNNKGNFSRYNTQFYITNTTSDAKMILYRQGFNLGDGISPNLVQFDCLNATGARLTSKGTTLQAKPCTVMALVDDKECGSDKTKQNKRAVQVGYWIKPGETISGKVILIVPLNTKPDVRAKLLLYASGSPIGSPVESAAQDVQTQTFVKIRNFSSNTYLNVQTGFLNCTNIEEGWWSAQWEILPVSGTSYFVIKNRWKNNFISNEPGGAFTSGDGQSVNSMWVLEPVQNTNTYNIKNAAGNTYLNIQAGRIQLSPLFSNAIGARWIIEQ